MNVTRLIQRKRDGEALDAAELSALIEGYVAGVVPAYQMAALAMAACVGSSSPLMCSTARAVSG